jgi:hypothetical protein
MIVSHLPIGWRLRLAALFAEPANGIRGNRYLFLFDLDSDKMIIYGGGDLFIGYNLFYFVFKFFLRVKYSSTS